MLIRMPTEDCLHCKLRDFLLCEYIEACAFQSRVHDVSVVTVGSQAMVRTVADRAMQIAEEAIMNFRSHRSSRLENAALLSAAMRLQILVTKCASGADCTDMGGVFQELLTRAAQQRFQSLASKFSADAGRHSSLTRPDCP